MGGRQTRSTQTRILFVRDLLSAQTARDKIRYLYDPFMIFDYESPESGIKQPHQIKYITKESRTFTYHLENLETGEISKYATKSEQFPWVAEKQFSSIESYRAAQGPLQFEPSTYEVK